MEGEAIHSLMRNYKSYSSHEKCSLKNGENLVNCQPNPPLPIGKASYEFSEANHNDSMRDHRDPCCNIQLKPASLPYNSRFMFPILEWHVVNQWCGQSYSERHDCQCDIHSEFEPFPYKLIIDREAREIMYLVASVRLSALSQLNRLTYFWCVAVDIRGSALQSAAKSKEESLSVRGVCLCVE